jgi:hypothetical protein
VSNRTIFRRDATLGLLALVVLPTVAACDRELECTDVSQLSAADIELRKRALGYTDQSPDSERSCSRCQQFKPKGEKACGACVVVRGPINPRGRCRKWAAKPV